MSSDTRQVTFELRADDRATSAMQALIQVMHEGGAASDDAKQKFQSLREGVVLQTRAFNTLRTEWRADNENLYAFSRVMQSTGAIGQQLLNIFNSIMLAQIAYAQTSQQLSQAQSNVATAQNIMNEMIATYGSTSQQAITATQTYIEAQNTLIGTSAAAQQQQIQLAVLYTGVALSIGGIVSSLISTGAALKTFWTLMSTSASAGATTMAAETGIIDSEIGSIGVDAVATGGVVGTFWSGLAGGALAAAAGIGGVATGITGSLGTMVGGVAGAASVIIDALGGADTAFAGLQVAISIAQQGFGPLQTAAQEWADNFTNVTVPHWEAGISAIISAIQGLLDWLNKLAQAASSGLLGALGSIKLPSGLGIPGFQAGGVVSSPTLAMVGEAGPEAIIPLGSAFGGGAGGGQTVINEITINPQGSILSEQDITDLIDRHLYQVLARLQQR